MDNKRCENGWRSAKGVERRGMWQNGGGRGGGQASHILGGSSNDMGDIQSRGGNGVTW